MGVSLGFPACVGWAKRYAPSARYLPYLCQMPGHVPPDGRAHCRSLGKRPRSPTHFWKRFQIVSAIAGDR
jgi:hypothetical protein